MLFKGNSSSLQSLIERLQSNNKSSNTKDTLGTEGGSSWVSEDQTTSPSSSCATPNSATGTPEPELSFTIGVTDGTPFLCRHCNKAFTRHSYCKKHEQTHRDQMPFHCQYCGRQFKHKRSRDRHIKLHTGDKKYTCAQCESAFSRSDHLKIHMKTHDKQKPFQCQVCNRGYNTAAALTSHMQNHKRSKENGARKAPPGTTFKCLQCSEIFRRPEQLQSHMNAHKAIEGLNGLNDGRSKSSRSPVVRLNCSYCTKDNFSSMDALNVHVQSVHKSVLNGDLQHENIETKPKLSSPTRNTDTPTSPSYPTQSFNSLPSYCCELCSMRFSSLHQLRTHSSLIHPDPAASCFTNDYHHSKYSPLPETISNDKLFCVYCALPFHTAASMAEHYVLYHSCSTQLFGLALPPEQMKPTDLSVARKAFSFKRTDNRPTSPKKKPKYIENSNRRFKPQLLCNQFQCKAAFSDFEAFRAHMKSHIIDESAGLRGGSSLADCKRPEFTCPHCRRAFSSSEEISQHVLAHFLVNSMAYECESCHKVFEKPEELQKHLLDIHARHLFSCSICNEVFDSKARIQVHFGTRHSNETKVYRCNSCPSPHNQFHSELEFAVHVNTMHVSNTPLMSAFSIHHNSSLVTCSICQVTYPSILEMQVHLAAHGKQFQCHLCSQSFHVEYLLDKHMQSHHNPPMNGNLEHEEIMKDLSPTQSPISRLDSPNKKMENGEAKGLLHCDICEKDFVNEPELVTHKRLLHNKLPSPGRVSMESGEIGDDLAKKNKINLSTSSSPTSRYDSPKKLSGPTFNGDFANSTKNNAASCETSLGEKRDFGDDGESQQKKLVQQTQNMKISPGKMNLHCAYCNENFKSRSELENHMKSHSQNSSTSGKHKCIICDEMCPTAAVLAEHKLTHCKVVAGRTCMQCKSSISSEEQFFLHMQQHSLMTSSGTKNNNSSTNNNSNKGSSTQLALPTVCVICRQTLVSDMEARMHARFHLQQTTDLIPCLNCLQMFERQDLVAGFCHECYQRRSDKLSPVHCPDCHVKCDNAIMLEIHLASVHNKNFRCVRCQVSFDNEKEIQHHMATHLLMDGLNGYKCRVCPMVLPSLLQLQAHMIEHSYSECAYNCCFCSSVFTTVHELQAHISEHGQSPNTYDCPRCKQKFVFPADLEQHNCGLVDEVNRGQKYFFNHEDKARSDESVYKMKSSSSTYEQIARFRDENDRYVNNGDRKQRHTFPSAPNKMDVEDEQPSVKSLEVKVECKTQDDGESEDEQIDVVTTKTEDVVMELDEKTDCNGYNA